MTEPTRLVLVRHAAPVVDASARVYGSLDIELSDEGHAHARELAKLLAPVGLAGLYSSPLSRATATARPIGDMLGLEVIVRADLREIDFGELEGLAHAEVQARHPEVLRWTETPSTAEFRGGDSVREFRQRAVAAAREIVAQHPGERVAVVSHAVTIRAIVADALGMEEDALFRLHSSYGGISVIDWFGDLALVRTLNATHI